MKLIDSSRERDWYLVKEWVTKSGLTARIQQCKWKVLSSLHDHYTGYVLVPVSNSKVYYDTDTDVHGGVTHDGEMKGVEGRWVGFDLAHLGDEDIKNPLEYTIAECEKLAKQIKKDCK